MSVARSSTLHFLKTLSHCIYFFSSYFFSLIPCRPPPPFCTQSWWAAAAQPTAALIFYGSSFTGHPWNVPSFPSSLILSGSWWVIYGRHPAVREMCVCFCVCMCMHIRERQWKNENRSFMAKSWEEKISSSARLPACMSLWLVTMEVHANTQLSQSYYFPFPYLYISLLSAPSLHYGLCRAPVVNSISEVYCTAAYGQIPD